MKRSGTDELGPSKSTCGLGPVMGLEIVTGEVFSSEP